VFLKKLAEAGAKVERLGQSLQRFSWIFGGIALVFFCVSLFSCLALKKATAVSSS